MFVIDRLLMAPLQGLMWIFREVKEAADEDRKQQRGRLMHSLAALHRQLECGEIDETTFTDGEQTLLAQLDALPPDPPANE